MEDTEVGSQVVEEVIGNHIAVVEIELDIILMVDISRATFKDCNNLVELNLEV
jgi:hypothetical protein